MAEDRTLGVARATQPPGEEEPKEAIPHRMELARGSISHPVTEIKEQVAQQVQAVKDTFDWREHYKKRPFVWSAGALGVGALAGYSLARAVKQGREQYSNYSGPSAYGYSSSSAYGLASHAAAEEATHQGLEESPFAQAESLAKRPPLMARFKESAAYENLSREASSLGSKLVEELSSTAHLVLLPFLLGKFKELVGIDRIEGSSLVKQGTTAKRTDLNEQSRSPKSESDRGH